jgi:hypothetical protein
MEERKKERKKNMRSKSKAKIEAQIKTAKKKRDKIYRTNKKLLYLKCSCFMARRSM